MFQLLKRLFRRRFWQRITFAEMAELYTARMLRVFALHMITVFVAAYLYLEGYNLVFIGFYFALYFLLRIVFVAPSAMLIARVGPKHGSLWGNLLYIPALVALALVPEYGLAALFISLPFKALSTTLYDLAHYINFSKVKRLEHVGKELGTMHIIEKLSHGISPLVGGFLAFWFGPQVAIITAAFIFAIAALPLLLTMEPIKTHQRISFKGISLRKIWRNMMAEASLAVNGEMSVGSPWNLFLLVVILATTGNESYAFLGMLSAISLCVSLVIPYVFGLLVDKRRGRELLNVSTIAQTALHCVRPFLQTPLGAAATNIASETASTGMKISFFRGAFDMADRLDGQRVAYMSFLMAATALGGAVANAGMALLVLGLGEEQGLRWMFIGAALLTLPVMGHGFALYRRKRV